MGLRELANQDLEITLKDAEEGFGSPLTIKDQGSIVHNFTGQTNEIGFEIDPLTGQAVMGDKASVILKSKDLTNELGVIPDTVNSETNDPWVISFNDIDGNNQSFMISEKLQDRTLGTVTYMLEKIEEDV